MPRDAVLTLSGQLAGEAIWPHNDIWYALADGGYIYSPLVQPVREALNEPETVLAAGRFWGEITMPHTDARWTPDAAARSGGRLYYSAVFEVIDAKQAADKTWWYQLEHGVSHSPGPWIMAAHLRRFDPVADLAPISPAVQDKRIEVNIAAQTMTAFESGRPVLYSRVASGRGSNFTPRGSYKVFRKAPGQRMIGGEGSDYYDLPGVPFPTYFTARGIALHGTYWHNDFGTVRSHGCVNVPSEVARWIWRWTTPVAPLEAADIYFRGVSGTPVTVI